MIKIKTVSDFLWLLLWVLIATWVINLAFNLLDAFTPNLPFFFTQYLQRPYDAITGKKTPTGSNY